MRDYDYEKQKEKDIDDHRKEYCTAPKGFNKECMSCILDCRYYIPVERRKKRGTTPTNCGSV